MREIKFRAWDEISKCMITHGDQRRFGSVTNQYLFTQYSELMQYTGLKDFHGNEIYEGDSILNPSRNNGQPHEVKWNNAFGGWVGSYRGLSYLIAQELHEIKVIGNLENHS